MVDIMLLENINLAEMAEVLDESPYYRVLRRLVPRDKFAESDGQQTRTGILLDVETTGLNTAHDEVIELAMVKFAYLADDRIAAVTDVFWSFNEPSIPIAEEVVELTRITDEMVAGHCINTKCSCEYISKCPALP